MSKQLYVASRTFKAGGKVYYFGEIVDDVEKVHRHTLRIKERKLLPIPEDKEGLERLHQYFAIRSSFNLKEKLAERASKGSIDRGTTAPTAKKQQPTPGTKAGASAAGQKKVQHTQTQKPKPLSGGTATNKK